MVHVDEESADHDAGGERDRTGGGEADAGRDRRGDEVAARAHVRRISSKISEFLVGTSNSRCGIRKAVESTASALILPPSGCRNANLRSLPGTQISWKRCVGHEP